MRSTLTRRATALTFAGLLALGATACGDDADTGTDVEVTTSESSAPASSPSATEDDTDVLDEGTAPGDVATETETAVGTETESAS